MQRAVVDCRRDPGHLYGTTETENEIGHEHEHTSAARRVLDDRTKDITIRETDTSYHIGAQKVVTQYDTVRKRKGIISPWPSSKKRKGTHSHTATITIFNWDVSVAFVKWQ